MLQLDGGELQGGLRRERARLVGGQLPEQAPGLVVPAEPVEGPGPSEPRLALQGTFGDGALQGCQRLDGLGGPTRRQLDRADLEPGPVDPLRVTPLRQFAEQANRPIAIAQEGERPRQSIPRPIGEPTPGMVRQRPFVGRPRRRHVVQGEVDVAQVRPGGLHRRVGGLVRREGLEGPARGRQVAGQVGQLPHAIPGRPRPRVLVDRPPGIRRRPGANRIPPLVEPGVRQAEEGVQTIRPRGPAGQEPLVLVGRQVELPLPEQPMGESQGIGDPPARRGCRRITRPAVRRGTAGRDSGSCPNPAASIVIPRMAASDRTFHRHQRVGCVRPSARARSGSCGKPTGGALPTRVSDVDQRGTRPAFSIIRAPRSLDRTIRALTQRHRPRSRPARAFKTLIPGVFVGPQGGVLS